MDARQFCGRFPPIGTMLRLYLTDASCWQSAHKFACFFSGTSKTGKKKRDENKGVITAVAIAFSPPEEGEDSQGGSPVFKLFIVTDLCAPATYTVFGSRRGAWGISFDFWIGTALYSEGGDGTVMSAQSRQSLNSPLGHPCHPSTSKNGSDITALPSDGDANTRWTK